MDVGATYANVITSMNLDGAAIPIVMNDDREAIALAVKTVVRVQPEACRIVRIRNTLDLAEIQVSEPMLAEITARPERFQISSPAAAWSFDAEGNLAPLHTARDPLMAAAGTH